MTYRTIARSVWDRYVSYGYAYVRDDGTHVALMLESEGTCLVPVIIVEG